MECPTRICPERSEDDWERFPSDRCEEVCECWPRDRCEELWVLKVSFRSLLHMGQKVALMNQRSTQRAWNTCEQSNTLQMSTDALKASWQIAQLSCLYLPAIASFQTTSSLCCTKASGMRPLGMAAT